MKNIFLRVSQIAALYLLASTAYPCHAYSVTGNLPLQVEPSGASWDTVVADATAQSTGASSGGTPIYHSTKLETTTLEGDFTADSNTTSLAIFSDDGCDVAIDGNKIWSAKGKGQALPDLPSSLHALKITLNPGQTYHVKIDYSNVIYTGNGDVDGTTLFAFGDAPPSVSMTADDPGDPDVFQQVTSKVHAKVDHLPSGHFAADLTATWTWSVVSVTHSDTVDGSFTTDGVDLRLFSLIGDNSDLTSPGATFHAEFAQDGYYEVEVQSSVKYHDNRTGDDLGPYGPGDIFLGDTNDEQSINNVPLPGMKSTDVSMQANQLSAGAPPQQSGSLQPKIAVRGPSPLLSVVGLDDTTKLNPGGLVVLNVAREGNSAPAQKIVLRVNHGRVGQSIPITLTVNYTGTGTIRIYDADAKVYLTNTSNNIFAVTPENPKTLYVEGLGFGYAGNIAGYSTSMRDIVLKVVSGNHVDKATMTVLWVGIPSFVRKDTVPASDKPVDDEGLTLGWNEVVGAAMYPSSFTYPTILGYYDNTTHFFPDQDRDAFLHLTRDVSYYQYLKSNGSYTILDHGDWSTSPYGHGNDTGTSRWRHAFPASTGGLITDEDAAGTANLPQPAGSIKRVRFNFRAWAVITLPSQQATPIRCSPIFGYFNRFSVQNGTSGNNSSWTVINPPDIVSPDGLSDFRLEPGTTPLSIDLR